MVRATHEDDITRGETPRMSTRHDKIIGADVRDTEGRRGGLDGRSPWRVIAIGGIGRKGKR